MKKDLILKQYVIRNLQLQIMDTEKNKNNKTNEKYAYSFKDNWKSYKVVDGIHWYPDTTIDYVNLMLGYTGNYKV